MLLGTPLSTSLAGYLPSQTPSPRREATVALVALLLAVALGLSLRGVIQVFPFVTMFPAVMVASVLGGYRAGCGTMVLGGIFALYAWVSPAWAFPPPGRSLLTLAIFWAMAGAIVLISYLMQAFLAEARRAERRAGLIADEMRHRLLNQLGVVLGLLRHSAEQSSAPEEMAQDLRARLNALARVQSLAEAQMKEGQDMRTLLEALLRPVGPERFETEGPAALVKSPTDLALILHELVTNSLKYGVLSHSSGRIAIRWEPCAEGISIAWTEPRVAPPSSGTQGTGHGNRLLKALGVESQITETDLRCRFVVAGRGL